MKTKQLKKVFQFKSQIIGDVYYIRIYDKSGFNMACYNYNVLDISETEAIEKARDLYLRELSR
jgi:hypothetical protein